MRGSIDRSPRETRLARALLALSILATLGIVVGSIVPPPARLLSVAPALFLLPGLALRLGVARRAVSVGDALFSALLFSWPLSAAAAVLAGMAGGSPDLGRGVLAIASLAVVALRSFGARTVCLSGGMRACRDLGLSALAAAIVSLPVLLDVNCRYYFHGQLHGSIVLWSTIGSLPPDNPQVAGLPLHFYWFTHVMAALLSRDGLVNPLNALAIANFWSLALSFAFLLRLASSLGLRRERWWVLAWTCLVLNALGGWRLFTDGIGEFYRSEWKAAYSALAWTSGEIRLGSFLDKFIEVNGFPQGVLGVVATLSYASRLRRALSLFNGVAVAGSVALTLLVHPTSGIAALVACAAIPLATRESPQRLFRTGLAAGAGVIAASPYLLAITGSGEGASLGVAFNGKLLATAPILYAPALPFVMAAILKRPGPRPAFWVAAGTAIAWLVLLAVVKLPYGNEYKYARLLAVPVALLGVIGTRALPDRAGSACRALVPLLALPATLFILSYRPVHDAMAGGGGDVTLTGIYFDAGPSVKPVGGALAWLRDHSSPRAVLIAEGDQATAFLGGRRSLITTDQYVLYHLDPRELVRRRLWMKDLFSGGKLSSSLLQDLARERRRGTFDECYLLLWATRPSTPALKSALETPGFPAALVFSDAVSRLYRLSL